MSVRFAFSASLAALFLFFGLSCEREENKDVRLEDGSSDSYRLGPNETSVGEGAGITFTTTGPWTATLTVGEQTIGDSEVPGNGDDDDVVVTPEPGFEDENGDGVPDNDQPMSKQAAMAKNLSLDWISIDPETGSTAGTYTMQVSLEVNNTGYDRSARIDIYCGESRKAINIVQVAVEEGDEMSPGESTADRDEREKRYVSRVDYTYSGPEESLEGSYVYSYDERHFVSHVSGPDADIYYEVDEGGHYTTNLEVRGNADFDMNGKPWWLTLNNFNVQAGYGSGPASISYGGADAVHDATFSFTCTTSRVNGFRDYFFERFYTESYWHEGFDEDMLREDANWMLGGERREVIDTVAERRGYETYCIKDLGYNGSIHRGTYEGVATGIDFEYSDVFLWNRGYEQGPLSNIDPNVLLLLCVDNALPSGAFSCLFLGGYLPYWSTNLISSFRLHTGPDYGYGDPAEEDDVYNYQVEHTLDEDGYVTGLRMTNDANESWTFSIVYE